jgi:uncharacterized protein YciI
VGCREPAAGAPENSWIGRLPARSVEAPGSRAAPPDVSSEGVDVEYFFYCRDRPGSMPLRDAAALEHQAFMDRYAAAMIARGPTITADGSAATGSAHFVDLPGADAAREFAFGEPNYRAGVYAEVLVRRWRNELGRTMWDFAGSASGMHRFLILGHGRPATSAASRELIEENRQYLGGAGLRGQLIASGPLLTADGSHWTGTVLLAELRDREQAEAILPGSPCGRAGLYESVEVHHWQFGGRQED